MCDPVTMGVTMGAMAGGGAYAAGGATIAGMTVGSVSLMQAATIGLTVGSSVMQVAAGREANKQDRISAGYDKQKYQDQATRYKEQADAQELQTSQDINDRKKLFLKNLSSNQAWMGSSGILISSASNRNLLQDNENTYKEDVSRIGLMGTEARYTSINQATDSLTARDSVEPLLQSKIKARNYSTVSNLANQAAELGNPFDKSAPKTKTKLSAEATNKNKYKMSVASQRKLRNPYGY